MPPRGEAGGRKAPRRFSGRKDRGEPPAATFAFFFPDCREDPSAGRRTAAVARAAVSLRPVCAQLGVRLRALVVPGGRPSRAASLYGECLRRYPQQAGAPEALPALLTSKNFYCGAGEVLDALRRFAAGSKEMLDAENRRAQERAGPRASEEEAPLLPQAMDDPSGDNVHDYFRSALQNDSDEDEEEEEALTGEKIRAAQARLNERRAAARMHIPDGGASSAPRAKKTSGAARAGPEGSKGRARSRKFPERAGSRPSKPLALHDDDKLMLSHLGYGSHEEEPVVGVDLS